MAGKGKESAPLMHCAENNRDEYLQNQKWSGSWMTSKECDGADSEIVIEHDCESWTLQCAELDDLIFESELDNFGSDNEELYCEDWHREKFAAITSEKLDRERGQYAAISSQKKYREREMQASNTTQEYREQVVPAAIVETIMEKYAHGEFCKNGGEFRNDSVPIVVIDAEPDRAEVCGRRGRCSEDP